MRKQKLCRLFSVILLSVLIAAMVLSVTGCGTRKDTGELKQVTETSAVTVGEGKTEFAFKMIDGDTVKEYLVKTDETTVGAALLKEKLIGGTDGDYGLMVDTVCGVKHDYNTEKKYWAFYEDGNYAATGVDKTEIKAGVVYSFRAENG